MSEALIPEWSLGDRLAKARDAAGVSRAEMAEYLSVSTNTISNYENDHTTPPAGTVRAWALRCGVPFDWIAKGGQLEPPLILDRSGHASYDTSVSFSPLGVVGQQSFTFPPRPPRFHRPQRVAS